ncbi:MAG: hypothetical protein BV459_05010 [Thermoplasmata archaeon M11B2D]|nr:MAG: hypothetical protein BV459_05010 [Thermoplasmata archaeon M11B2D]
MKHYTPEDVEEKHFNDKTLRCSFCKKDVFIPYNQVGGFWHLNSFTGGDGEKYYGGACPSCFDTIKKTGIHLPEEKPCAKITICANTKMAFD